MKLCYNQATTMRHSTLEKDLEFCEKYGYDLIEIRIDKLKDYLTRNTVEDLVTFFEKNKIKPFAFNGLEEFSYRSEEEYAETVADLKLVCEISDRLNCKMVTMDPGATPEHLTVEEIQADNIAVLNDLLKIAKPYDMRFAFEFCGSPECSVNTLRQAMGIVNAMDCEEVGVIVDFFHFWAMGSKIEDLEKMDVTKIFMVHIDDAENYPKGQASDGDRLWPGDGVINIDEIMKTLLYKGYNGVYSLELFRPEYWEMDVEEVIRIGKEKSDAMLSNYYR